MAWVKKTRAGPPTTLNACIVYIVYCVPARTGTLVVAAVNMTTRGTLNRAMHGTCHTKLRGNMCSAWEHRVWDNGFGPQMEDNEL